MTDRYLMPTGFRIISGGQTGADRAGLDWAIANGVSHGGWCPAGRKSEDGRIPDHYLLQETGSRGYLTRTEWNVRDSDATVIFTMTPVLDGGSKRTLDFAEALGRPCLHVFPGMKADALIAFLTKYEVRTLNSAGKRASSAPGVHAFVMCILDASLSAAANITGPDVDEDQFG